MPEDFWVNNYRAASDEEPERVLIVDLRMGKPNAIACLLHERNHASEIIGEPVQVFLLDFPADLSVWFYKFNHRDELLLN